MSEWNQEEEIYHYANLSAELDRRMDGLLKKTQQNNAPKHSESTMETEGPTNE